MTVDTEKLLALEKELWDRIKAGTLTRARFREILKEGNAAAPDDPDLVTTLEAVDVPVEWLSNDAN